MFRTRRIKIEFISTNTPNIYGVKFEIHPSYGILRWNHNADGPTNGTTKLPSWPVCWEAPQTKCNHEWKHGKMASASLFPVGNFGFRSHNFKGPCDNGKHHQYTVIQDIEKTVVKCDGLFLFQDFRNALNNTTTSLFWGVSTRRISMNERSFKNFQVDTTTHEETRGGAFYIKNGSMILKSVN